MTVETQIAMGTLYKNGDEAYKKKHHGFEAYYNAHKEVIDMEGETPEPEAPAKEAKVEDKEEEEE